VDGLLAAVARADGEKASRYVRLVGDVMCVGDAGFPADHASFTQRVFVVLIDQRELAGENVDEFIFLLMPVAQRRERAGLERNVIDAELVHADGAAKLLLVLTFEALGADRLPISLIDESDVGEMGKPYVHESGLQSRLDFP
jgi:hypothetical protein